VAVESGWRFLNARFAACWGSCAGRVWGNHKGVRLFFVQGVVSGKTLDAAG
jgi:hypothetical protein